MGCHCLLQCMKVKSEREVAQSCLTLCYPMDRSLPGSSVLGIFLLEWGAVPFSSCLQSFPALGYFPRGQLFAREGNGTPLMSGKSHGQRSLVGCSPWGREESDTTERLPFHFSLSCIGEGNGNPLQCSCLENPKDGRAWWAAVSGVAQSQTRLK